MLRNNVVLAVFKRNVQSYFSGVLGYLFIVVFVVAGAFAAFNQQFFANNQANLDQLSLWYPLLLLFIIPAITMGAWADEKKMGTDELLFTLPASDLEILLGKFFAVLAVYTIALLFSVTHVFVLWKIGNPDMGLMFTTYFGYWLAGASLLAAGMFASALTSSTTVAFVLGTVICAIPIFIGQIAPSSELIQSLSLVEQFQDFSTGVIPLGAVLYFNSLAVMMLYLNRILITRRHWSAQQQNSMGLQYLIRTVSLAVILISANVIVSYGSSRIDMTGEKVFSVSQTTRDLLSKIDEKNPITIEAFISPEVSREYVPIRKRLIGLLREYNQLGGKRLQVRFVDVEPFSKAEEEARLLNITPQQVQTERGGRAFVDTIFMGAVVKSGTDEVVIPFFNVGTPIEYELTRSIRTVSKDERLTVGILNTDASIFGGLNMGMGGNQPPWLIVSELKKQYKVEQVSPDSPISDTAYDVLIAVLPSSLTEPQLNNLVEYVEKGKPTLICDDPLPVYGGGRGIQNAPRMPKPSPGGGMFGMQQPPSTPKADDGRLTPLLNLLQIRWDNGQVVFDYFNPHPEFAEVVRPELIFISPKSGTAGAFSQDSNITSGLQEILTFFPGSIRPLSNMTLNFEPLLKTGPNSGLLEWGQITSPFFNSVRITQEPPRVIDKYGHVLAAHITSTDKSPVKDINVIFVADADLISDELFNIRERQAFGLKIDNVTFLLNCVDQLAGDDSYIKLRKRRSKLRTLTLVERETSVFVKERNAEREKATENAEEKLKEARDRLKAERDKIIKDTTIDGNTKQQMLRMAEENESRRLEVDEANIEREKQRQIEKIKAQTERQIRTIEDRIRWYAILFPPFPAILLGICFLFFRMKNENQNISPDRRLKK
ncbi:Gldg family protein [Gimesia maris]|uniref:Gldg family protein n=1 Tax=Gimesia maris TaxID=122 RepID=UPI00241BFECA|nr:Gldg family protein [Gimesia maris]|tara:strand:- start:10250 stop:12898 length:2649 start_codon:yes stop_codon:yes gene_type:complete